MNYQSEQTLENNLITQLKKLEYDFVAIKDEDDLMSNLKRQLELHNSIKLSNREFDRVLNHLNKGNVFERAKILSDKMQLTRDNGDSVYIEFINMDKWCKNEYQVTNQISMDGTYKNRYDVTLLINGIPLVQVELKRRGLELKEAFNQTGRYRKHSFWAGIGLFQYIQIFVISNGVNTKYYANNKNTSFKQTFFWADELNNNITNLEEFAKIFLEPCHLSKMITKYIVLNETEKALMVLRPYQFFAVEKIIDRVINSNKNGYIWHTTGSGKTLTSFKASQILTKLPNVDKVVFVVDRKDLDYQTANEFNSFSAGSVDGTDDTKSLVKQFEGNKKLIITTIQKLNTAISKEKYTDRMADLKDKKVIFIFDECHRSQFGETHKRIKAFFNNHQMFGFTGTPIFAENAMTNVLGTRTTKELFDECLHKYVIVDAIKDENVLKFSIEYIGKYKEKEGSKTNIDINVEGVDTKELLEDNTKLEKIVDYILANHNSKTYSREFSSIFCVSSVDVLIKYYEIFKKKNHNLNIATIFSYGTNEDDTDATGLIGEDNLEVKETDVNKHTREKLDEFIIDYNNKFDTKFSTKDTNSFYNYYKDVAKRVKGRQIDILLVVNMFLTGFDSKTLNTLYVDKNLKYHGLIQAFSRTNRILGELKSQGNIVCFRNLKKNTDEAIALFSDKDAKDIILMEPFESYIQKFNETLIKLLKLAPSVSFVDELITDGLQLEFVTLFRELLRIKNILTTFADFSFDKLDIDEQTFEDYKSKYLDIYEKVRSDRSKKVVSILEDVDFELELISKDNVNVDYILSLLSKYYNKKDDEEKKKFKNNILNILENEPTLRSKKELIKRFIEEYLGNIGEGESINESFEKFLNKEKQIEFEKFCKEENIDAEKVQKLIGNYLFSGIIPIGEDIAKAFLVQPGLIERKSIINRILDKMMSFVEKFEEI